MQWGRDSKGNAQVKFWHLWAVVILALSPWLLGVAWDGSFEGEVVPGTPISTLDGIINATRVEVGNRADVENYWITDAGSAEDGFDDTGRGRLGSARPFVDLDCDTNIVAIDTADQKGSAALDNNRFCINNKAALPVAGGTGAVPLAPELCFTSGAADAHPPVGAAWTCIPIGPAIMPAGGVLMMASGSTCPGGYTLDADMEAGILARGADTDFAVTDEPDIPNVAGEVCGRTGKDATCTANQTQYDELIDIDLALGVAEISTDVVDLVVAGPGPGMVGTVLANKAVLSTGGEEHYHPFKTFVYCIKDAY